MKLKNLFILLAVLAVLAIAAVVMKRSDMSDTTPASELRGQFLFEGLDVNQVESIKIHSPTDTVNLAKKDNQWVVSEREDFPANLGRIQSMFTKFLETHIVQAMQAGESQNERLQMLSPDDEAAKEENKATLITFKGAGDSELATLTVGTSRFNQSDTMGNPTDQNNGRTSRYLRLSSRPDVVLEVPDNFNEALASSGWPYSFAGLVGRAGEWLDKSTFINPQKVKSVQVSYKEAGKEGFRVSREKDTADYTLDGDIPAGKQLDSSKTSALKTVLASASFEDVLTNEQVNAQDLSNAVEATIETFEGFTYKITIGPKDEENNRFPVTYTVDGEFPKERVAEEGKEESEEDKKKADESFLADIKKREEKLAAEKKLAGRWYTLSSYRIDPLLKSRADLLKDESEAKEDDGPPKTIELPSTPASGVKSPVSATTPPIQVPPPGLPEKAKAQIEAVSPVIEVPPAPPKPEAVTEPVEVPSATPVEAPSTPAAEEVPAVQPEQ